MANGMPGHGLRQIREKLGLTLKEVEAQSRDIAESRQNPEYLFTAGRLSQVENSFSLPSLYKLSTLSQIYQIPYKELLRFYGIETEVETAAAKPEGTSGEARQGGQGSNGGKADLTASPLWG